MTLTEFRALVPSATECVHLNHAGMGPIPQPTADAVVQVTRELMGGDGLVAYKAHLKRQAQLRETIARMLNVAPEGIAFVRNTSHGLTIAAQAIPFSRGENVVVARDEYPSVVYPWQAQAYRGVETRLVESRAHGLIAEDDLMAACDRNTRVLAVSWVQWGTGQRMDLDRLGDFCNTRGIWFVVDLIQGFGALELDLAATGADIAAGGSHKWLLSPSGIGPLYVKPERLLQLLPTNVGWNWVNDPYNWDRLRFEDAKPTADRFEEGSPGILSTAGLLASATLLEAVGGAVVEAAVLANARALHDLLRAKGMEVCPTQGQSGIVAFRHPEWSNEQVLQTLEKERLYAAVRCGWVRLSPHAYQQPVALKKALTGIIRNTLDDSTNGAIV